MKYLKLSFIVAFLCSIDVYPCELLLGSKEEFERALSKALRRDRLGGAFTEVRAGEREQSDSDSLNELACQKAPVIRFGGMEVLVVPICSGTGMSIGGVKGRKILIAPSLTAATPPFKDKLRKIEKAGADWIHVDIDEHGPSPDIISSYIRVCSLPFDLHFLEPAPKITLYAGIDVARMTIPFAEEDTNLRVNLTYIKGIGCKTGIAINPETSIQNIIHFLRLVDHVTVMGVQPGRSGQPFIPDTLGKIRDLKNLRAALELTFLIVADGGVRVDNARCIIEAGADVLVAGSSIFVFGGRDYQKTIHALLNGNGKL